MKYFTDGNWTFGNKGGDTMPLPDKTIKYLKHDFTEKEMDEMKTSLASKTSELRRKAEEKKAINSQFSSAIETLETETLSLADRVNVGYEHRSVECEITYNWKKGVKRVVNPETKEVVEESVITAEERQVEFPAEEKKEEKKPKKEKKPAKKKAEKEKEKEEEPEEPESTPSEL